jgi:dihydroorotase
MGHDHHQGHLHGHHHHYRHPHHHRPNESHHRSRREFIRQTTLGASLFCWFADGYDGLLRSLVPVAPRDDLLIKGGWLVDPSQGIDAKRDVAISGTKVTRIAEDIAADQARHVLDARAMIVTPGLIDTHAHVYDGVAPLGIPADPNHIAKGTTTVVDAGSSGAATFPGFLRYVINVAETRVVALLNISLIGQSSWTMPEALGEMLELRYANPRLAAKTIERHRDVIVGIKVRLGHAGGRDLEALALAREAAEAVQLPIMVHIGSVNPPLADILGMMRKGDVLTHSFRARDGGILDDRGRVLPEVHRAIAAGVNLDIGHGAGSFSFETAEAALAQDVLPGTISSDLHHFNVHGPVFDLATTMSKFLHLGLTLSQVVERATLNPSRLFGRLGGLGTLRVGAEADVAVFALDQGDFDLVDSQGVKRVGHRKLRPVATVKGGRIYGSASIPVVTTDDNR